MSNRPFNFRVWDKRFKRYFPWRSCISFDSEEYIVEQSTGLKDKNGVEIFEGDLIVFLGRWDEKGRVIEPNFEPYEVSWAWGGLRAFKTYRGDFSGFSLHEDSVEVGHTDSRIIGNIHETETN
jgi:uncharacterized phage protein (TIGR01671 family)